MATMQQQLGLFLAVCFILGACTDGRVPKQPPVRVRQIAPTNAMVLASEIRFQEQDMNVLQMTIKGNNMFLSGTPFGFMRWDVGANAEAPELTAAASNQIDQFAPFGKWVLDWYASGALGILGRYVATSGIVGASVIDTNEPHNPVEVRRHPRENEDQFSENVVQDEAFIYRALVAHPTKPFFYGFRQQDKVFLLSLTSAGLQLQKAFAYGESGETVCCVESATVWNNKLIVAFRSKLVWYDIQSNGDLTNYGELNTLQAANVVSTPNFLYVQHEPNFDQVQGNAFARGIYVFSNTGEAVAFFPPPSGSPRKIAVTSDDSHIFMNVDGTKLEVYRIEWVTGNF